MTIFDEWEVSAEDFSEILRENPSLKGMLFGYIAEIKLRRIISSFAGVSFMTKFDDHDRKKKGDLYVIYNGRAFDIEAKSLQTAMVRWDEAHSRWIGKAQVDASDRRVIKLPDGSTMNTTLLLRGEFDILAVNCYAFDKKWHFAFARNRDLPTSTYKKYTQVQQENVIASLIPVTWPPAPPFYADLRVLLDEMVSEGAGKDPHQIIAEADEISTDDERIESDDGNSEDPPRLF